MLRAQRFWGETVSLLDVMWPRSNQWDCALLRRNFQLYNNLSCENSFRARKSRASCVNCYFTKSDVSADVDVQLKSSCSFQRKMRFFDATDIYYATSIITLVQWNLLIIWLIYSNILCLLLTSAFFWKINHYFALLRAWVNHVIIRHPADATISEFTLRPLSACSRVFSVNPPLQKYEERSEKDYKQLQSECPFFIHPLLKFENLAFLTILSVYYHLSQWLGITFIIQLHN